MKTETLERILSFAELPYAVQRHLHCSGQRTVYLGTNTDTNDTIVVKVCNYAEIRVARIQREIKILQGFDTPYFPKVEKQAYITKETLHYFFDSFDPRGDDKDLVAELQAECLRPFFLTVEEYIEHQAWSDIQDLLRQEPALVAFMIHVFEALRMLWKAKIVHRDLKPDNLLVRHDMTPTVIDLGIAKSFCEGTMNLTAFGFRSPCTPEYASPEQLQDRKTDVTYKSDQYSFGVLLYELLTGNLPYGNIREIGEEEIARRINKDERILLVDADTGISHDLAALIDRLLAVEPYKRFRNVDTILDELSRIRSAL